MREKRRFVVFGFDSTHAALEAEALLEDLGHDVTPVPAPQQLSARCGIALRIDPEAVARAERQLENAGIPLVASVEIEDW